MTWTPTQDDQFRRLWAHGMATSEMARMLGKTIGMIVSRRKALKLEPREAKDQPWTKAEDVELTQHVGDGLSAAEIGRRMGKTKLAVIGRCRRLRLQLKGKPNKEGLAAAAKAVRHAKNNNPSGMNAVKMFAPKPTGPVSLPRVLPTVARKSHEDVGPRQCRYIGELPPLITPETLLFCGQATAEGESWCPEHRARIMVAPRAPLPVAKLMRVA